MWYILTIHFDLFILSYYSILNESVTQLEYKQTVSIWKYFKQFVKTENLPSDLRVFPLLFEVRIDLLDRVH